MERAQAAMPAPAKMMKCPTTLLIGAPGAICVVIECNAKLAAKRRPAAQIGPNPPAALSAAGCEPLGGSMGIFRRNPVVDRGEEIAVEAAAQSNTGRVAAVISAIALALSLYSLWETSLKRAGLRVFVPS